MLTPRLKPLPSSALLYSAFFVLTFRYLLLPWMYSCAGLSEPLRGGSSDPGFLGHGCCLLPRLMLPMRWVETFSLWMRPDVWRRITSRTGASLGTGRQEGQGQGSQPARTAKSSLGVCTSKAGAGRRCRVNVCCFPINEERGIGNRAGLSTGPLLVQDGDLLTLNTVE